MDERCDSMEQWIQIWLVQVFVVSVFLKAEYMIYVILYFWRPILMKNRGFHQLEEGMTLP